MTKRRVANNLIFKGKPVIRAGAGLNLVANLSGTGTVAKSGVITVIASNVATKAYITLTTATQIGTLIGTSIF